MSTAADIASTVDNRKAREELARIQWRAWVLAQPGGPGWLCERGRLCRFRERSMGPRDLSFLSP